MALRTFLALPFRNFEPEISSALKILKPAFPGARWIKPDQAHVTLHFFGETKEQDLPRIRKICQIEAAECSPLQLRLSSLGFFPHESSPRIIWLALSGDTEQLESLQRNLFQRISREDGFVIEERSFKPHLTLGRLKPEKQKHDAVPALPQNHPARIINSLILYESRLRPGGSEYVPLETFHFSKPTPSVKP